MSKKNDLEHTSTMLGSQNMKSSQRMVSVVEPYELPEGWKWCRLGDVAEIIMGQSPAGTSMTENKNDIAFIGGASDMGEELPNISRYTTEPTKLSKRDDVIVCIRATLGRPIFSDGIYCLGRGVAGIRSETLMKEYIKYGFLNFEQYLYDKATGSTFLQVSSKYLNEMPFPLPPTLAEQQRIVNRIESMFAKLDEAKEKAQNVVDGFETRKAAILHKAFTGELTAKWRKENGIEKNKELDFIYNFAQTLSKKDMTNITDFQKQAYDYVLSDGAVWKKCCIGAIGVITNGSTPSRKEASFWNGNIPWVSSGEVANNTIESTNEMISEEGFNNSSVKKLPIGTVLIAMIGEGKTRGQTSVLNIEATTNQNIAAIIINHGHVESKFLWYWLQKEYKNNRTAGNGSGPQALNCQKVRELPFILPTLPEQVEIIRILDIIIEKENKAKQAAEAVLEQIDLLKKSILARAFRGEL